jgi:prevent-host-death family protein
MQALAIPKFKATCLSVLENVNKTGRPVRITRFGKPVAEIVPCAPGRDAANWLGFRSGTLEITGEIVGPSTEPSEWNALPD